MDEEFQEERAGASKHELLNTVIGHREAFLRFLTSRLESSAIAEDVLQTAHLKAIEHGSELRENDNVVARHLNLTYNARTLSEVPRREKPKGAPPRSVPRRFR